MTNKIFIILIILNLNLKLGAQSYQEKKMNDSLTIESVRKAFNSSEINILNDLERLIHSFNESENKISVIRRNIQYGSEHQIWWADILQTAHQEYFSIILQNNKIIAIEFRISGNDEANVKYIDKRKLQELKKLKEEEFGTISLGNDLLFPLKMKLFGHWCSIGGSPPEYCYKMLDLVNERNKNELRNWLLSFDPEIQAYGAEGLFYIEKEGIPINDKELELIEEIKMLNNTLIKCEGCFFYMRKEFKDDFQKKKLKRRYKAFKGSGWIYEK